MKKWTQLKTGTAALALSLVLGAGFSLTARADHHGAYMEALAHPDRPAEDKARDANRKPMDVLMFAGVKQGMTVVDTNSAGGYYTEVLSHLVGAEGEVYAHNGPVYWAFMKESVPARFAERLANVVPLNENSEALNLPEDSVDVVMSVLAYHDYFFNHAARTEPENMEAVLASIYKSLKPGGAFVVVDHEAPAGTGSEMGDKLHRLNSDFVKKQVTAAGFTIAGESDVLANPDDDKTKTPFVPEIRGKTDRYIIKFVK